MSPLDISASLGHVWQNVFYVLTGVAFGFALERAGFGNARNLAAQFYLKDMRVLKVMFTAIITAMLLIFWANLFGLLDARALFINPTHLWPGILGGLIFGIGFVVGGYCPGTALVSLATLKIDGMLFVLGLAIGMFLFGESIDAMRVFWDTAGNFGELTLPEVLGLGTEWVVFAVVLMALAMFWGAERVEQYFARKNKGEN